MPLPPLLRDVLALPTAPFHETAVLDYILQTCASLPGVTLRRDRYQNILARYRHKPRPTTPLAFVAHTDHPGFVAAVGSDGQTLQAAFYGGVRPEFFPAAKVRFWVDGRWIRGVVEELTRVDPPPAPGRPPAPRAARIRVRQHVPAGSLGMWDLPDPVLRDDRVVSRVCDDLAGVAALLALLQRLSTTRAPADVYCLFTRAEEVGFVGAVGSIRTRLLPRTVPVFSIETSSALPHAPVGAGPIVRIGDRGTIYTAALDAFTTRVAQSLTRDGSGFQFQRRLMDGGMCEAAAFGSYGYAVLGICLALGNYHNMDTRRQKIASEFISLSDWNNMVVLFEALVRDKTGPRLREHALRPRIDQLFNDHVALLE